MLKRRINHSRFAWATDIYATYWRMLVKFGRLSALRSQRLRRHALPVRVPQLRLRFFFSLRNLSHESLFSYMLYTPKRRSFWSFSSQSGWYAWNVQTLTDGHKYWQVVLGGETAGEKALREYSEKFF